MAAGGSQRAAGDNVGEKEQLEQNMRCPELRE